MVPNIDNFRPFRPKNQINKLYKKNSGNCFKFFLVCRRLDTKAKETMLVTLVFIHTNNTHIFSGIDFLVLFFGWGLTHTFHMIITIDTVGAKSKYLTKILKN